MSLDGKTILVTGATDGLGKLTAARLASEGATVLLHGRDQAKGEAARRTVASTPSSTGVCGVIPWPITMLVFMKVPGCRAVTVTPDPFSRLARSRVNITCASLDWR